MNKKQVYLGGCYLLNEYKRGLSDLGGCMRPTEYLVLVVGVPKKCHGGNGAIRITCFLMHVKCMDELRFL